ncbi:MAG: hypothetical protein L0387_40575 [Acidobacteria bacterium]|nr:hypothetical protein [Acidobacteriota bacterium]
MKIERVPCSGKSPRDFAKELLTALATQHVRDNLTDAWGNGLRLEAYEVRAYDDGTAVQFWSDGSLNRFRELARQVLAGPVGELLALHPDGVVESLIFDGNKSRGDNAFGSIARSARRFDKSELRCVVLLPSPVTFTFKQVHLLTSDHALTNPRMLDVEEYWIPPV